MSEHSVNRRRVLKLASASIVATTIAAAPGSGKSDEQAPSSEEYDALLAEMDGDGSRSDPYIITDVSELQAMDGDIQAHYALGNNIDATPTITWNNGDGFEPIADSSGDFNVGAFEGTLTGNGYYIDHLVINRTSEDRVALFRGTDTDVVIEDVLLVNADISGQERTGGLSGASWGTIKRCGVIDSTIQGTERVGGIVANANGREGSTISNVFTVNTELSGDDRVGGIVGRDWHGEVKKSFSTDNGIIGYSTSSTTESVYYENSGANSIGVQLTQEEMQGTSAAEAMEGFDFDSVWDTVEDEYPIVQSLAVQYLGQGTVTGTVIKRNNDPVHNATIEFVPDGNDVPEATVKTDEHGTYEIELPVGEYQSTVTADGFAGATGPVTVEEDTTTTNDAMLNPARPEDGTVTGSVIDDSTDPLDGATVEFVSEGDDTPVRTAETEDDGRYEVKIPAGEYEVTANAEDFIPKTRSITVTEESTTTEEFALERGRPPQGTATGSVTDDSGNVIESSAIEFNHSNRTRRLSTDNDGKYEVEIPAGEYEVTATASGYESSTTTISVEEEATTVENFELSVESQSQSQSESEPEPEPEPEPDDQADENGDIEVTVPGFGIPSAIASLGGAGYLLARRFSDTETDTE